MKALLRINIIVGLFCLFLTCCDAKRCWKEKAAENNESETLQKISSNILDSLIRGLDSIPTSYLLNTFCIDSVEILYFSQIPTRFAYKISVTGHAAHVTPLIVAIPNNRDPQRDLTVSRSWANNIIMACYEIYSNPDCTDQNESTFVESRAYSKVATKIYRDRIAIIDTIEYYNKRRLSRINNLLYYLINSYNYNEIEEDICFFRKIPYGYFEKSRPTTINPQHNKTL